MPKAHKKAPHNTHAAIAQTDLLLNAAMKKSVPTTAHQMGIGSHIKVSIIRERPLPLDTKSSEVHRAHAFWDSCTRTAKYSEPH